MTRVIDIPRKVFPAGHVLMRQGDRGTCAWLIVDGQLDIARETPSGLERLDRASTHEIIGEMALIDDGPRTATVSAVTDVVAIELTRGVFEGMFNECEPLARIIMVHLIGAIRHMRGMSVPGPKKSGPAIRSTDDLNRILERRVFAADHVVFREGDRGELAYLIQSGKVRITQGGRELEVIGPGRIFGELALINKADRNASATTVEGTTVEIIKRMEFESALAGMPQILRALMRAYVDQIAFRER
jgi:CRP-like cAMP-binding protein